MNDVIKMQLNHRTIRFFKDEKVSDEILDIIKDIIIRTATSNGLQSMSVIRVTDKAKKEAISKIANQNYLKEVPELFIFVIDTYRNAKIAKSKGYAGNNAASMDNFFQGCADAYLAAQNACTAIESLGLGSVYFGSILNDSAEIIKILDLPKLTFPILGLGFGYPDDEPMLKPRMDARLRFGENSYPYSKDYISDLKEYDEEMQNYYDTRNANTRVDSFTNQVLGKLSHSNDKRNEILKVIKSQGFDLNL